MRRRNVLLRTALAGGIVAMTRHRSPPPDPRAAAGTHRGGLPALGALPSLHEGSSLWSPSAMLGQVWGLNVWASWCAPCRAEHPLWVEAVRSTGLTLIGLNTRDDPHAAREWLLKLGDPYRVVALDRDGDAAAALGLTGVPASFVFDAHGIVRLRLVGPMTRAAWDGELLPLLRGLRA